MVTACAVWLSSIWFKHIMSNTFKSTKRISEQQQGNYLNDSEKLNLFTKIVYNFDPLKPHFYIVKLGFAGVYIIFLISAKKHRLWILVRTASVRRF